VQGAGLGGINHRYSNCHLAKFRVSIIMGKFGAVIGWRFRSFV